MKERKSMTLGTKHLKVFFFLSGNFAINFRQDLQLPKAAYVLSQFLHIHYIILIYLFFLYSVANPFCSIFCASSFSVKN
jgi:hypothetical protein